MEEKTERPNPFIHVEVLPDGNLSMSMENVSSAHLWAVAGMLEFHAVHTYGTFLAAQQASNKEIAIARGIIKEPRQRN